MHPQNAAPSRQPLFSRVGLKAVGGVSCGEHRAPDCGSCPSPPENWPIRCPDTAMGCGSDWCNGDCQWDFGEGSTEWHVGSCVDPNDAKWQPASLLTAKSQAAYRCTDCAYTSSQQRRLTDAFYAPGRETYAPSCLKPEAAVDYSDFDQSVSASIVVPVHHEEIDFVQRTVDSIVTSVPPRLLREIILVDDANWEPQWKAQRDALADYHPSVRVVSGAVRLGLVQAKNLGAAAARAPYIIFLESHVEVLGSWFSELMRPVVADRSGRTVVVPHIA